MGLTAPFTPKIPAPKIPRFVPSAWPVPANCRPLSPFANNHQPATTMNTKTLILAATTAGLFTVVAQAADTPDNTTPPRPPQRHGQRATPPEMQAWRQKALEKYDANKNGVLDPEERDTIKADIDAGKFAPPPACPHQRGKRDGQGRRDHKGPPPPPPPVE